MYISSMRTFCFLLLAGIVVLSGCGESGGRAPLRVGILQFGPDPTIDRARQGVVDALAEAGYVHGGLMDLEIRQGDGDYAATQEIARRFADEPKDLIIALTTPGLQAAILTGTAVPVVFAAVYDPYRAGAARTAVDHLPTVCGVASFPPVAETLALARELVPGLARIGTIRHPAEVCAASSLKVGRQVCQAMDVELVEILVDSPAEVGEAAEMLAAQGVDLFYITGDNTVLLNFAALVDVARRRQIPLLIHDNDLCPRGAAVSMGFNFYRSGLAGGRMAARVLAGEDPASIPIEDVVVQELWVNPAEARLQGLEIPAAVKARAHRVVGD
jgi:ABC-type uncharacterized transport system substrate-binding protein